MALILNLVRYTARPRKEREKEVRVDRWVTAKSKEIQEGGSRREKRGMYVQAQPVAACKGAVNKGWATA
jgi:hypothetical protein